MTEREGGITSTLQRLNPGNHDYSDIPYTTFETVMRGFAFQMQRFKKELPPPLEENSGVYTVRDGSY